MTQSPAKKSFFNRNVDLMNGPIFKSVEVLTVNGFETQEL